MIARGTNAPRPWRARAAVTLTGALPVALTIALGACTSGPALEREVQALRKDIARAREAGAERCAPKELAMAESHTDFISSEVAQGNSVRAAEHAEIAKKNIARAIATSDPSQCSESGAASAPVVSRKDTDGDGLFDDEDGCPLERGAAANKGCPVRDSDGDTVVDELDQCPSEPGPPSNKGCPIKDTDGDGVLDGDDQCPTEAGPVSNKGCPVKDRDGDGVPDDLDQCPDVPGEATNNGCPKKTLVVVKNDRIEIKQQVHFQTARSKILKDSFELLRQVAAVLRSNPAMKLRIEGHTDNVGGEKTNLKLSDARAKAVRLHLIGKESVAPERLTAEGFGSSKPIAPNSTAKGRAANRRVEFNIVAK